MKDLSILHQLTSMISSQMIMTQVKSFALQLGLIEFYGEEKNIKRGQQKIVKRQMEPLFPKNKKMQMKILMTQVICHIALNSF